MNKILRWDSAIKFKERMETKKASIDKILDMEAKMEKSSSARVEDLIDNFRSGVLVLMVSDFENFLKNVVREYFQKIFNSFDLGLIGKLPKVSSITNCGKALSDGINAVILLRFPDGLKEARCKLRKSFIDIFQNHFDYDSLIDLKSTNYNNIKQLFKPLSINLDDLFSFLPAHQVPSLKPKNGGGFAQQINSIVKIRNNVVHFGKVDTITSNDLETYCNLYLAFSEGIVSILAKKLKK